jgi:hypothetical protein
MITEHNLLQAIFTNDEGTNIQAFIEEEDGSITNINILVDADQALFQELMTVCSIAQIEAWTDNYYEAVGEEIVEYQRQLIEQGKVSYLRATGPVDNARIMSEVSTFLFLYDSTSTDHVEKLFNLKLEMFEIDAVDSASDEDKISLREADTPIAAIAVYNSIVT